MSGILDHYEAQIPNLTTHHYVATSDYDPEYNCIAWAAGETQRHWWPTTSSLEGPAHWPHGVAREETLDAFIEAFATLRFTRCATPDVMDGVEKLAIYVSPDTGKPTHIARQLLTGRWTSKLNIGIDIEHPDLAAVEGTWPSFGVAACFLERAREGDPPVPPKPWPAGRPRGRPWPIDLLAD